MTTLEQDLVNNPFGQDLIYQCSDCGGQLVIVSKRYFESDLVTFHDVDVATEKAELLAIQGQNVDLNFNNFKIIYHCEYCAKDFIEDANWNIDWRLPVIEKQGVAAAKKQKKVDQQIDKLIMNQPVRFSQPVYQISSIDKLTQYGLEQYQTEESGKYIINQTSLIDHLIQQQDLIKQALQPKFVRLISTTIPVANQQLLGFAEDHQENLPIFNSFGQTITLQSGLYEFNFRLQVVFIGSSMEENRKINVTMLDDQQNSLFDSSNFVANATRFDDNNQSIQSAQKLLRVTDEKVYNGWCIESENIGSVNMVLEVRQLPEL